MASSVYLVLDRVLVWHSLEAQDTINSKIYKMSFDHHIQELHKVETQVISLLKKHEVIGSDFLPSIYLGNRIIKCLDGYAVRLPGEVYVGTRRT